MNTRALAHLSSLIQEDPRGYQMERSGASYNNISKFIYPQQFERLAFDIGGWRAVIREMEQEYYPSRVKCQRMFMDTIINPFILSLVQRWRELTLQRDYEIYQFKDGKKIVSRDLSQALNEQTWFPDYTKEILDAKLYGYSLIELGDIVNDSFPFIKSTRRENILPDGNGDGNPILTNIIYSIDGLRVKEDPLIRMCNHWIPTKPERSTTNCGYGLLYNIAFLEINLRHILEWNLDFAEGFGMPIKIGSTNKEGKERDNFEALLANSSSRQYALIDKDKGDSVEYEMAQSVGTAWKTYDNLESRLEAKAAQLVLGHTDAMVSTPGKLGGQQAANKDGFNESLIEQAMNAKQLDCGNFLTRKVEETSAPLFRELGRYVGSKTISDLFPIGYHFGLQNDKETINVEKRKNATRTIVATYVKTLNDAGWDVDESELGEALGGMKVKAMVPERKLIEERTNTIIKDDEGTEPKPAGQSKKTGEA